jgi:hypothetical protein
LALKARKGGELADASIGIIVAAVVELEVAEGGAGSAAGWPTALRKPSWFSRRMSTAPQSPTRAVVWRTSRC